MSFQNLIKVWNLRTYVLRTVSIIKNIFHLQNIYYQSKLQQPF